MCVATLRRSKKEKKLKMFEDEMKDERSSGRPKSLAGSDKRKEKNQASVPIVAKNIWLLRFEFSSPLSLFSFF